MILMRVTVMNSGLLVSLHDISFLPPPSRLLLLLLLIVTGHRDIYDWQRCYVLMAALTKLVISMSMLFRSFLPTIKVVM